MLKKQIRSIAALAVALSLAAAGTIHASEETNEPDKKKKETPGLKVGVKAPAFKLKDQNDKDVALSDILKKGPVALVFYRSASWWPHCKKQLVQLQKDHDRLTAAGIQIVALSYDSPEILKKFGAEKNIKYTLLSDPESKTIEAYKIRNKKVRFPLQEGIPHPTTFVVDRNGIIQAKLPGTTRKRHTTDELLDAVGKMKGK